MKRDEAKSYILDHGTDYFRQDKSRKGFICPICGSGSGKNGSGITSRDNNKHFTCWAGCFTNADIFEIIGKEHNTSDFNEQFRLACEAFNIIIDTPTGTSTAKKNSSSAEKDYLSFYSSAKLIGKGKEYAKQRGLSAATAEHFNLGYCENWKHPKAPDIAPTSPRLIIPVSPYNYLARDIRDDKDIPTEQQKFKKSKAKSQEQVSWLFNAAALEQSSKPVFVLEGEIDAMSVYEVGGEAVAIGSTAYWERFIEAVKKNKPTKPLLLSLDNDEAGQKCKQNIANALKALGIPYKEININNGHKDANEALVRNRETFAALVKGAEENAENIATDAADEQAERLYHESAYYSLQGFKERYSSGYKPVIVPTGFRHLDEILNGGLRPALYTIGAISSLGKTSLCIQIADNIAKQGKPVLFVSLEMARDELVAKCLSRITYQRSKAAIGTFNNASTTVRVMNTDKYNTYSREAVETINAAIIDLEARGTNLLILEGVGDIGVKEIKQRVQEIKAYRGEAPIVFIDYLQILAPEEAFNRGTDKQAVDKAVLELKRLSRDEDTPVVCISSFSRENYTEPVSLKSFKESGAIEYTSDVLLGLQYAGMDYTDADAKDKDRRDRVNGILNTAIANGKAGQAQDIELKVLKNRNGSKDKVDLEFVPMFNYFEECEEFNF